MQNSKAINDDPFYQRKDIYFCLSCGHFHDSITDKQVNIPYTDMPADFALAVMYHRQWVHDIKRKRRKTGKGKGFKSN